MHCFAHGVTWSANKAQYTAVAAYRYKEVRLVKCNSVLINQVQHTKSKKKKKKFIRAYCFTLKLN